MKQNVFEVLMYLFENYMNEDAEQEPDQEFLNDALLEAGFRQNEIQKAFAWLEGLTELEPHLLSGDVQQSAIRVYSEQECNKLNADCRGFLMFLEQMGVLDSAAREMVLDRVMALESDEVDLEQLKWVTLMVLFNQPGREEAFAWMEDLVLDEMTGLLH